MQIYDEYAINHVTVWELIDISLVGGGRGNGEGRVEFRRDIKQISGDIFYNTFFRTVLFAESTEAIEIWRKNIVRGEIMKISYPDPGNSGMGPMAKSLTGSGVRRYGWGGLDNTSHTRHSLNCQSQLLALYTRIYIRPE